MTARARAAASRRMLRDALCDMVAQGSLWRTSPNEESLHDFRISLRRCRGLLRILQDEFPVRHIRPLRTSLSRIAGYLGEVRDLDVMLELAAMMDRKHKPPGRTDALVRGLQRQRLMKYRKAVQIFAGPSWTRIQARIDHLLLSAEMGESHQEHHTMAEVAAREYERLVRSVYRSREYADATNPVLLHIFRTKLRRLRYFGRIMADHVPDKKRKRIRHIRECEQQLGRVHDVDVMLDWMERHPRSSPGWMESRLKALRAERLREFQRQWRKKRRAIGA